MPSKKSTIFWLICVFSFTHCTMLVSYFVLDWQLAEELSPELIDLCDSIKRSPWIVDKISDVDVSYLCSQYDILRLRMRYRLSYDEAKLLYQYHTYHNRSIGSITELIEYEHLKEKVLKTYDFPKNLSELTPAQHQAGKVMLLVLLSYWLIIFIGSSVPRYK